MKTKNILSTLNLTLGVAWAGPLSAQTNGWTFDLSLCCVAAGISGDVTVRGIPANANVGIDTIWDNLKFGAMGTARVGYDRWPLSTDVIYMDLGAS